jgi:hypothetical protein
MRDMQQTRSLRITFPMRSPKLSIYVNLPAALWPYGRHNLLTEMSTRNLPAGKVRPARNADNFTAIYDPIGYNTWEPRLLTTLLDLHSLLQGQRLLTYLLTYLCTELRPS